MNLTASSIFKQITAFFNKLSKGTKILIFTGFGIIVVGAMTLSFILNNVRYTVLYRGLSSIEGSEILSLLDDMAVSYKVENDNTILVPTSQEATLKMQLASEGYPKSALNYDIFTEQSDLLTTDYEKKKLLIFQLQDRLQASIKTLQGVKTAIVNLSIPDDNSYVLKDEKIDITASVLLELYSNAELTVKQVKGIEQLVANSVPGLNGENVVIINGNGEQLNGAIADSGVGSANIRIETVNLINEVFKNKIKDFLKPIFGEKGMSIAVNVIVDFDQVSSEETVYTPVIGDNGIITWIERSNQTTGAATGDNNNIPTYEESNTSSGYSEYENNENYSAEYLVNQLVRVIQNNGGNIKDMTVAVIINLDELSDEDKTKYRELVAYSAGISVDKVALTNVKFIEELIPDEVSRTEPVDEPLISLSNKEIIIIAGAGILFFVLIIILFISSSRRKKKKKRKINEEFEEYQESNANSQKSKPGNMPGEIVLNETREQALKRQIKEFSAGNAETVAQLLRVWIKEDENN
ncbi:MAG: flagellar M-ring protein FliF [Clostridiales bacterium GWF2_38_85]|nr:MAG: flagellar M-ring protein FliF [Clostridiales bacterium GWF2_38_85]HBL83409.1 flagellar M-ring protein FliF [Clostridiales bacterium]